MTVHIELAAIPSGSRWLWRRKSKCTDVKNLIFVESLRQHEAVLSKQSRVEIVHRLKEPNVS